MIFLVAKYRRLYTPLRGLTLFQRGTVNQISDPSDFLFAVHVFAPAVATYFSRSPSVLFDGRTLFVTRTRNSRP